MGGSCQGGRRELATGGDETDESPDQVGLLADIETAFATADAMFTKDLLAELERVRGVALGCQA